ncbi:MAG: hypothetical protein NC213_05290 [Acetobacter sp.]|nr:hypothetical protein [Bacteroides sp.]MCM1341140.1 hypothetical protein [Acetobacter sp.]MCM1433526.1 hypothetical protein [Clostridiales bacterium]
MDKKKYIDAVTKNISSTKASAIQQELSDHIETNQEFYQKIGYEQDTAEAKAVECMGEYEETGEMLSKVHNEINFTRGMISSIVTIILLFIIRSTISAYNDITNEHFSFIIAKLSLGTAVILIYSFLNIKWKNRFCSVLSLFMALCTSAFTQLDFAIADLGEYLGIFETNTFGSEIWGTCCNLATASIAFAAIIPFANMLFNFIYCNRLANCKNSKNDLKTRDTLYIITKIMIVINIIICIACSIFYINVLKNSYTDYKKALNTAITIEQNAQTTEVNSLLKPYTLKAPYDYKNLEGEVESGGFYNVTDYNAVFEITYEDSEYYEDDYSKIGYYHIDVRPRCNSIIYPNVFGLADGLTDIVLYSNSYLDKNEIEELRNINTGDLQNMNKTEIIEKMISFNPYSLNITIDDTGSSYTLGYQDNSTLDGNNCSEIIILIFDEKENLTAFNKLT